MGDEESEEQYIPQQGGGPLSARKSRGTEILGKKKGKWGIIEWGMYAEWRLNELGEDLEGNVATEIENG